MADSKKFMVRKCRFWPEIHEFKQGVMGAMRPVRPVKAHNLVAEHKGYAGYQLKVNLREDLLVGPFDFMKKTQPTMRDHLISDTEWVRLKQWRQTVDVEDVDEIRSLR